MSQRLPTHRPQLSPSNMTSSLTGAMGDTHGPNSQRSGTPASSSHHPSYSIGLNTNIVWTPIQPNHTTYPGVAGQGDNVAFSPLSPAQSSSSSSGPYPQYQDYHSSSSYNTASESLSPDSPSYGSSSSGHPSPFATSHPTMHQPTISGSGAHPYPDPSVHISTSAGPQLQIRHHTTSGAAYEQLQDEVRFLRRKTKELATAHESARQRVRVLEAKLAQNLQPSSTPGSVVVARTPLPSSPFPMSTSFQAAWQARTDARTRLFCSLNRAGNALCAWHDSRRERRAYQPRMAPHGHLNCGCTHEEALFEESLARHGVGSYYPGERGRMDPALRNPLLKLLQT